MKYKKIKAIISGGGTGGHIFPALSIANKLKELNPDTEILFVGAEGRMEMDRIPEAGYKIIGLPVAGLQRSLTLSNLALPFKLIKSLRLSKRIIKDFKPDIAIGVGGYASAPLLWSASRMHIPTLIQEQNSYAGLANKILGKKAKSICVAYEGMDKFFPSDKIVLSGNPIRKDIIPATEAMITEGLKFYNLSEDKKHIFIVGGSLGSKTLNDSMMHWISEGCKGGDGVEILWQCGRYYLPRVKEFMKEQSKDERKAEILKNIKFSDFIQRMDLAYAMADIVISRSGASSISELCVAQKACIFVPSPNVAEDHQTHNAMALVNKDAGILVKDSEAVEKLLPTAFDLLANEAKIASMEKNIGKLAKTNAAEIIAEEVFRII